MGLFGTAHRNGEGGGGGKKLSAPLLHISYNDEIWQL